MSWISYPGILFNDIILQSIKDYILCLFDIFFFPQNRYLKLDLGLDSMSTFSEEVEKDESTLYLISAISPLLDIFLENASN